MDILRNKKNPIILLSSLLLPIIFTSPANATEAVAEPPKNQEFQSLTVTSTTSAKIVTENFTVEVAPEPPAPAPVRAPQPSYSGQAALSGYSNLLDAARAQLGRGQDCTALVENALRAIGINAGDMGPMGFGAYGHQISPDQAQAGDIMMRGGHVAIYAGNGVAIHGGFNGSTVESTYDANPYNYAVIVRI